MKERHYGALLGVLGIGLFGLDSTFAAIQNVQDPEARAPQHRRRSPNGQGPQGQGGSPGDVGVTLFPFEYRTIDGSGNHRVHTQWGSAEEVFLRRVAPAYGDGTQSPAGQDRVSPRVISNAICAQVRSIPNARGASDFLWAWGQFLDHDLTETPLATPAESLDIEVPLGDPHFDPLALGGMIIPMDRSSYDTVRGRREQVNALTAYIDGSQVYGSEEERAHALRTLDGTGRLKTSPGNLLPYNVDGLPNAPHSGSNLFLAGDIRANEQVLLTVLHTVFVREHNYWADVLRGIRDLSGDEAYQMARAIVIAELQAITYREFLPTLLGPEGLPAYTGYQPDARASISNLFASAGYRFGHTMLPEALLRLDVDGQSTAGGPLPLAQAFFRPDLLVSDGLEPYLRGAAHQVAQEIDPHVVDGVRNFLFGAPGAGGFDLPSLNMQRGRDHGLPSFLEVRRRLGTQSQAEPWTMNAALDARFAEHVGPLSQVDPWIGFLAERKPEGSMVGRSLGRLLREQFQALRDGDRFYYESYLSDRLVWLVESQTLAVILRRNTEIGSEIPENVFLVP